MCNMMLLLNLAEPDWVSIPCDKNLLRYTLCYKDKPLTKTGMEKTNDYLVCSKGHTLAKRNCYVFLWSPGIHNTKYFIEEFKARPVKLENISFFKNILDATSLRNDYPIFLIQKDKNFAYVIKFERFLNKIRHIYYIGNNSVAKGFYTYQYNRINIIIGSNLFNCTKGGYILYEYMCDGKTDCPSDQSDEQFCICNNTGYTNAGQRSTLNRRIRTICSNYYYVTKQGYNQKFRDNNYVKQEKHEYKSSSVNIDPFICNNGIIINEKLRDDLIFDCGPQGEDEPILMSLLKHEIYSLCVKPDMIPCMEGHSKCYYLNTLYL